MAQQKSCFVHPEGKGGGVHVTSDVIEYYAAKVKLLKVGLEIYLSARNSLTFLPEVLVKRKKI